MSIVATLLRIGPTDVGRTMSLEEFLEAEVEEGYRYELARGVLEAVSYTHLTLPTILLV